MLQEALGEEGGYSPSDLNERRPVVCNTSDEAIFAHLRHAVSLNLPWLGVNEKHDGVAVLVGGGPSLRRYVEEIRARQKAGQHVFALNGTLEWLAQKEIIAHSHVLLDARESNVRFVLKAPKKTKYYVASQCHPKIFEALSKRDVTVWQPNYPGATDIMGHIECALIGGGTTVGMQAMSIAWALGYRVIHLYGFDSSYETKHGHAYRQLENDGESVDEYEVNGKTFRAANWMARQADEFQIASRQLAEDGTEIHVHGDGLLPWVAKCMEMPPGNLACYDLSQAPASWDFVNWLVMAEINRRERGFEGPLKVCFKPGPKGGFRDDTLPMDIAARQQMLDGVLRPVLKLIGAVESEEAINGCRYDYRLRETCEASRNGIQVPKLVPSAEDLRRVDRDIMGNSPVVITLREATHWQDRNSNLSAWLKFAEYLVKEGESVVFVRDTEKADERLPYRTLPQASKDIGYRAALYHRAKCNLMVMNGPLALCMYGEAPFIFFRPLVPNYVAGTEEWWRKQIGIPPGESYPWAKPNQRIAWCDDTLENIVSEWTRWRSE